MDIVVLIIKNKKKQRAAQQRQLEGEGEMKWWINSDGSVTVKRLLLLLLFTSNERVMKIC